MSILKTGANNAIKKDLDKHLMVLENMNPRITQSKLLVDAVES